jgi:dolichol kinase
MNELPNVDDSYLVEVMRKGIHLSSLSIPVIYYFISQHLALSILVPMTAVVVLLDVLRLYHEPTGRLYARYLGFLLRRHEQNNQGRHLNGATWVLLSASITMWLFPKVIFLAAFAILIVSDTAAALVGRRFGRHRFFGKSVEGSTAFFATAVLVILLTPKIHYLPLEYGLGFAAALIGAVVEASPLKVDDNLSIPFSIGGVMWAMYALLLPAVDVFSLR